MNRTGAIPKLIGGARPKHRKDWIPSDDCRPMPSLKLIDKNQITPCCNRPTESSNSLCSDTSFKDSELSLVTNWDRPTAMTSSKCNDISELLPVEKREIPTFEEGLLIKIPALHPKWVEKKVYINYSPPPYPNENEDVIIGASEAWLEQIRFLEEDLIWLLSLPHYRFWSQIVYDKDVSSCLGSYLENGTRWFDTLPKDEDSLLAINTIHQLVFLLYVRMATHKESLNNYFTPSAFGHIIYDNYLFDIGKIIDLCSLYRPTNRPLLEKLVSNLFSCQPKYYEDLKTFVTSIKDLMDTIENKLGVSIQAVPLNLSQRKQSFEERMDTIDLLLEISSSLEALLNVFPNAAYNFHEQNFLLRLSSFYERVIPALGETFSSYSPNIDEYLEERILKHIQDIRINILAIFRQTLSTLSLPLQANITNIGIELEKQVEVFVNTLTNCVADKVFISDYTTTYDLEQDIKYFQDLGADVTSLNFVREAVHSVVAETLLSSNGESLGKDKLVDSGCIPSKDDTSGMNGYYAGQTESLSKVEIASLISSVKDLLSHLGNGFIKECLKYYNYSAEECLHALLEENLPKCLTELDRSLPLSESEANFVAERKKEKDSPSNVCLQDLRPLDSHSNIYDDDKCSSFLSENINLNIHKGKWKSTIENEKDQSLDEKMKSIARQYEISNGYSIYEDEEKYEPLVPQEYEDEYDDTYDDKEVGDVDNFSSDRKMFRMPSLKGKGALNTPGMNFLQESSSDEVSNDEEEANYEEGRVRHFIELPDKKANASCKRWYKPISDGEYCGDSMVFTRSLRKGEWDDKHCCSKASSTDGAFRGPDLGCAEKQRGQTLPDSAQTHCETRRRMQRKMMSEQHQNKQELQPRKPGGRRDNTFSSTSPPSSAQQSWRSDLRGDNETSGGRRKHKEESNHGKAQDPKYRYKMIHKNENKRNMAHAKFKGSMLQCGEDIVVGRGNKKAVKFWSSDDELMKVEVIPERNFHNDASGILNIFRKPMFPQGHAKKKDDVVPTSHQSNISIAALSEDNHQIVGAATRPAHFRITDDLSHYSKYIAPVIREEPIFMKDKQTREDQILMRNKQTREDQILMQNKQTRKDQILMQDKQTREDQILLQDKQTREDQILMQDKRTREDQILMQDKQTREDQILKQDKRNREDQILMQDKRTREDPILMQNKPIELQENSNSVLKISGTNLTKEAEETYETIIPSNAKEHDPFTNEDKNDHSLSADTSKKLTNFQDGPENFHTDSKDKLEFKKVNINISDSDQEAETMVDIKASNSAAESHIIKNASSDFSERIIKSSDSHHPQSFILQNGNPIDFEKLMSDKQTFINEDSKRQNLEAEQDHKVENDVSKVQIQNYATSVENYNKIKVEGIEESSHMKLDKHDADLEQIAGSQIIIPLSIVKNTYNLKSQNSDAKETLEYVSKEIINSQEKLDEDIDKTYERETVRDDLENSSVEIDSTTFDKINNSKIGFAWQNMENISPKFTEILLKLEKMPLNSVDLTNKISQPIEIYPEDIGYIENQSDPTHVNIDILKNIVNQVSVKQQGLGIKDEYVSNPVILSEPEVIDTFDKDKAVATSDNTKEVLNVIGFVQNNDQKQKNSHVKSEDISMPETAIEESKLQKNDCIIVKPAVIEDKSADIVPNSNVGRNPSISVDKKLENALNKTEEILYHNNSNRYSNNINRPIYPEETRPTPSVKNEVSDDQDNSQTENLKSNYKEIPIPVSFIHKTDEAGISDNILTTDNDPLKDLDGKLRNQESDNKATNILQSQDTNVVKIINENNIFSKETGSDNALSLLLHGDSKLLKPLEENSQYSIPIPFLYKLRDNLNAGNENPVVIKEPGSKVVIITPQSNTQSDLYKVNEVIALDNIAPKVVMPEDGTKLPSYNEKKEEIEIKSSKHEIDTTTEKDDAEDKLLLSLDESQAKVTQDGKKDNFITLLEKYVISDSKLDSKLPEAISNEAELDKKHNKHVNRKIDDEVSAISYEGGGTNFNEGETAFNFMRRPNDIYKLNQPNLSNLLQTRKGYVDHSEHGSNSLAEGGIQALRDELQHPHGGDSPFFIKLPGSPNAVPVFLQYEPVKIKYIDTENLENTESNLHPGESPSHHFQIDDPNEDGLQFELLHSEAYSFDSKPESNIRKHPDPFFYMDAPNLGNNDDSSKVTMQQTKLDPQLKDDSFLVNLKSKLNFERKDPLSSLDANNEVIYPGRYFTKKPDNSYSSSNIAALTNPVFSLGSKLKIPYVTPSNPQYTPFPLTTNPPSHVEDNNLPIKVNGSRLEVTTEFAVSLDTDQQLKESPNIDFLPAPSINFDDSFDGVAYPDLPISERLKDESVYREENHKKGGSNEISQTEFKDDLYNSAGAGLPPKEDDFDIVALANVLHKNQKIWSNSEIPPIHDSGSWRGPSWNTIKYSVENSENGWDHALGDSPWLETSGREYTAFYSPEEFPGLDPLYFSYKRVPKHIREPRKFELSNVSRLKQFIERLPPRLKTAVIGDGANFRRHKRSAKFGGKVYCEWNFRTEPGLYLLVTFHNLSAPFTVDCYGAYIEVERESNGYGARWCGNRSILNGSRHHVIFAKHKVRISVYDNGDITKTQVTGFEAEIEAIDLFDTEDYNTFLRTKANEKIRRLIEG